MKQTVKLNEHQLRSIVSESVKKILNEEVNQDEVSLFSKYYNSYDDKVRNLMSAYAFLLEQHFGHSKESAMADTAYAMRHDTIGVTTRYE